MRCGLQLVLEENAAADDFSPAMRRVQGDLSNERFVRIADDVADLGKGGQFFGRPLGVAARDDDLRVGVASEGNDEERARCVFRVTSLPRAASRLAGRRRSHRLIP